MTENKIRKKSTRTLQKDILGKSIALSPNEQLREEALLLGREDFWSYCKLVDPKFFREERSYQKKIAQTLQALYEKRLLHPKTGKPCRFLIINLPPGAGKSYTVAMFVTWLYGRDLTNKVVSITYNQLLSGRFSKSVRGKIEAESEPGNLKDFCVRDFFPKVKIKYGDAANNVWALEGSDMSYLASSFGGSLTGMRGNIGIIDDPIKNKEEAVNERVKADIWDFYKNTFKSRMLDGAIEIIIQTRWASDDLAGMLLSEKGDQCYELRIQALSEEEESFCEDLYSKEDLLEKKATLDEEIWLANYMQQPIDRIGGLYGAFKTYDVYDKDKVERQIAYVDTADMGKDYLCCICADVIGKYAYITSVYYTDESMEITEGETARRLHEQDTRECAIESNNGGRGFARNVEAELKKLGNKKCNIHWLHQSKNKRVRILVNASNVMEQVIFPEGWERKWPQFYRDILKYQRKGSNEHDDAPDTLTGIVEILSGDVKIGGKLRLLDRRLFGF
ncbi:MAG: phage terminase large subunit [Peptostreptococcaceae bacterium]|nr:phage terminase large subunit [Peptostreptococcaceae bacterium]